MRALRLVVASFLVGGLLVAAPDVQAIERRGHGYRSWQTGNLGDVRPVTKGGAFLAGGASDRANGWRWFLDHAGYGDIVIIRATGDEAYNPYVMRLGPVDSVQTLKLTKRVVLAVPPGDGLDLATFTGDGRRHTVRAVDGSVEWDA